MYFREITELNKSHAVHQECSNLFEQTIQKQPFELAKNMRRKFIYLLAKTQFEQVATTRFP